MTGQSILIVDDEPNIREIVALYLERAGFQVQVAGDGRAALQALTAALPDLVILDIMLPGIDGLEITRRLRSEGSTPVILLTARREEADRVEGLELGADDYVVKPFSPQELVSRVRAVLRRTQAAGDNVDRHAPPQTVRSQPQLAFDGLTIDPAARIVQVDGAAVMLTVKEFDLLLFLASHPHQVFNRGQLLAQVWGETQYIDASTVTVHVRRLREKLEKDPSAPRYVQTVWGVGYRFSG
jgi:DNA-binding response OmpR family regulator